MRAKLSGILSAFISAAVFFMLLPVNAAAAEAEVPNIKSECAVVADISTGQILYAKNMSKKTFSPITNRILTVLEGIEEGNLRNTVQVHNSAVNSKLVPTDMPHIAAKEKEIFIKEDLLYAVIIAGAADAANIIATASVTLPEFTDKISRTAENAGCTDTGIANANGRESEGNFTTVKDIACIIGHAYKNETFKTIWKTSEYIMTATEQSGERRLKSACPMIGSGSGKYLYAEGGISCWAKNGSYSSAVTASNNKLELVCVLSECKNADDRWSDTEKLFEYFFNNYEKITVSADYIGEVKTKLEDTNGRIMKFISGKAASDIEINAPAGTEEKDLVLKSSYSADDRVYTLKILLPVNQPLYPEATVTALSTTEKDATWLSRITGGSTVKAVFLIIGIVFILLIAAVAALFIYAKIEQQKRRRRKQTERKRRLQAQAIMEANERNK